MNDFSEKETEKLDSESEAELTEVFPVSETADNAELSEQTAEKDDDTDEVEKKPFAEA